MSTGNGVSTPDILVVMGGTEPEQRPSSERRSSRRFQFLQAGAAIVDEAALCGRLPHFDVQSLLDRIPGEVTRGAFTNLWKRKEDYERELVHFLLDDSRYDHIQELSAALSSLAEERASSSELILRGTEWNFDKYSHSQSWRLSLALTNLIGDPEIGQVVKRDLAANYAADSRGYAELYRLLLVTYGLRMRPGLTVEDLTVAVSAITEGFALRWTVDPGPVQKRIDTGTGPTWSLVALATEALVSGLTEPDPDSMITRN